MFSCLEPTSLDSPTLLLIDSLFANIPYHHRLLMCFIGLSRFTSWFLLFTLGHCFILRGKNAENMHTLKAQGTQSQMDSTYDKLQEMLTLKICMQAQMVKTKQCYKAWIN